MVSVYVCLGAYVGAFCEFLFGETPIIIARLEDFKGLVNIQEHYIVEILTLILTFIVNPLSQSP